MTARARGSGVVAAMATVLASSLIHAAPEDLPPEEPSHFWVVWSPKILDQFPIYVAGLCLVVVMTLHWLRTRNSAHRWRGEHAGWATLWLLPCVVGFTLYLALLAGMLIWAFHTSLVFSNYFETQFFMERKLIWFLGWLIAVSPGIVILLIPGRRGAPQGRST